jgi:hypothetical protein
VSAAASGTTAVSAAAVSAAAAASSGKLHVLAELGCDVFLVEDIERPQADVGDFLFAERNFVT